MSLFPGPVNIFESSVVLRFAGRLAPAKGWTGKSRTVALLALCSLLVAHVFSPKIPLGRLGREIVFFRWDDLLVLGVLVLVALKTRSWKRTAIDLRMAGFALVCLLSVISGALLRTLAHPLSGLCYFAKMCEYLTAFYLVLNLVRSRQEAETCLKTFFFVVVAVSIYGLVEFLRPYPHEPYAYPFYYRLYERGFFRSDANHIGALLMFAVSIAFGIACWDKRAPVRLGLAATMLLACCALVLTFSRGAYVALAVALAIVASARSPKVLLPLLIVAGGLGVALAPAGVADRLASIKTAFLNPDPYTSSIAYRIQQMKLAFESVAQYPLFGVGLGARQRIFYENQYIQLLSECGVVGIASFFALVVGLYAGAVALYRAVPGGLRRGLAVGYIAGLTGLMLECNLLVVFLITRVAGPFWFVTGIVFWMIADAKREAVES